MNRFMMLPMLIVLFLCSTGDAAAQDTAPDAPILWLSAQQSGSPTHVYTWDGERAINLTPNASFCHDFFPLPLGRWGWVCSVEGVDRLFLWEGHAAPPQIISGSGSVSRELPAIHPDGRLAFVVASEQDVNNGDLVVWDDGETHIVSGDYGAYLWETPQWMANGTLVWRALQTDAGEYAIYHWDGERVEVIAERQPSPLCYGYGCGFGRLWITGTSVVWRHDLYDVDTEALLHQRLFYWAGGDPIQVVEGVAVEVLRWLDDGQMFGLVKPTAGEPYSLFRWDGVTLETFPTTLTDHPTYTFSVLTEDRLVWYAIPEWNGIGRIYLFDGEHNTDVTPDVGAIQAIVPRENREYLITADREGVRSVYVWTADELVHISSGLTDIISAYWRPNGAVAMITGEEPQQNVALWTRDGERQVIEILGMDTLHYFWDDDNRLLVQGRAAMGVPRIIEWRNGAQALIREGLFLQYVFWHPNGGAALLAMTATADVDSAPALFAWQEGTLAQVSAGLYLHAIQWRGDSILLQLAPSSNDHAESHDVYLWDGRQLKRLHDNPYWDGLRARQYIG